MMNEKLVSIIMRQEVDELTILSLKDKFTPVELATQLNQLTEQDIVSVDWKEGIIKIKATFKDLFLAKSHLIENDVSTPENMKSKKIDINKPLIENEKGELENGV